MINNKFSRLAAPDLGYVLQIERHEGRPAGHHDTTVTALCHACLSGVTTAGR